VVLVNYKRDSLLLIALLP